jgi:hypothetical protein
MSGPKRDRPNVTPGGTAKGDGHRAAVPKAPGATAATNRARAAKATMGRGGPSATKAANTTKGANGAGGATPAPGRESRGRAPRPMPGGAEVLRAQRRAAREGIPAQPAVTGTHQGVGVIRSVWAGTAVFAVTTAVGAVVPSARIGVVGIDLLLMLLGSLLYFWGWAVAAGRSRDSEISLWNLILLEDAAPRRVRFQLLGAVGVQVIVAAATCWITAALAFGWLVPLWGLAHCEYWGARYGTFLPRKIDPKAERGTRRR